jgi:hypothetical protein
MSKRDDSALRSLAEKTGGTYFPATQGEVEVQRLLEAIGGMEKRSLESRVYGRFENHYRGPLWLVLFLLVLEFLISEVPGHFGRLARRALGGLAAVSLLVWPGPTVQAMGRYPTVTEKGMNLIPVGGTNEDVIEDRIGLGTLNERVVYTLFL